MQRSETRSRAVWKSRVALLATTMIIIGACSSGTPTASPAAATTAPSAAASAAPSAAASEPAGSAAAQSLPPAPQPPEGVVEFQQATPGSGTGMKIGFINLTLASTFPQQVQKSIEDQIKIAGAALVSCDSKLDAATALNCAKTLKQQGVQGQFTFQADSTAAARICQEGAQVPVFAVDIAQEPCQVAFMGAANQYAGQILGYELGKYFLQNEKCQYDAWVSLEALQVGAVNEARMGGIRDGFASVCGPVHDIHTLDSKGAGSDIARGLMADTLTALPNAHKIITVGINEDAIIGAIAAARAANRDGDLYLGVQNFAPTNCVIYQAPHWIGSVAYFPERYGEILVPYMIKAIKGETVPKELLVPHVLINKDNAKQYYPEYSCS